MNFATWSIRNPVPAILLFVMLALAGLYSFRQLPIANLPDMDLPRVTISLSQPGAAPTQLETEVARKVENSLATLSGLKHIRTSITDGLVQITVEFVLGTKPTDAVIETKDAVDRVRSDLPSDLLQPTVSAVRAGTGPLLVYAVAASAMDEEALSWFVDDTLNKAVMNVPGIGRFERIGGVQRQVGVEVDPVRLVALGVTAADVSRALRSAEQTSSGGRAQVGGGEQALRTDATVRLASDLRNLPIVLSDGRRIHLDQVATVTDTHAERTQLALLDGKPVVGFKIYRATGFDETRIAAGVEEVLGRLGAGAGDRKLAFTKVSGTVDETREQYEGSMRMLYEGAMLAVLVVLWFLQDWRATLIAASALPLSILPTFVAMSWLGYSLNTLTLLALAVIVGILVDDAIVEIENIERHRRMGKPIKQAAGDAVTEIAMAVIATTMTLVVVFLPTAMMSGIAGMFFQQFGWTAVVAVLSSLLVARLLTPMMAAYLLKDTAGAHPAKAQSDDSPLMTRYLAWVRWCFAHRRITMVATVAVFAASVAMVPLLKFGLIPPANKSYSNVGIELPPGGSLNKTLAVAEATRHAIAGLPGIERVMTTVGDGAAQASDARRATLIMVFAARDKRPPQVDIENRVRQALAEVAGARFSLGAGGPGEKLSLILASDDPVALKANAQALERQLRTVAGLTNINSTAALERPEILVRPDAARAAELGVTTAAIGETMRVATGGDFDARLAKLDLGNRQVGILVRVPDAARRNLDTVGALRVPGRSGLVPLASVASLSMDSGPSQIDRYDRRRYATVSADLGGTPLGQALAAAKALPAVQAMPASVHLIETGDAEIMAELMGGFGLAIAIGLLCVYAVLVLLFHDFFQPVTILSAVPLSLGGAFIALLATKGMLSIPSLIGLVMLMGIVTKNSILLVEYAVLGMHERGLAMHEALLDACHKRARPIIMTTIAMVAGMLPIALGMGADSSFRQPMAIAVIGGLVTSTALSLLVVPVAFTYVSGFERRVFGWLGRKTANAIPKAL